MKTLVVLLIAVALMVAPATVLAAQTRAKAAPYRLEGKLVEVYKGWIEVEVTKVLQGAGFKTGDKVKITEGARTRILQAGKRVSDSKLAAREMVQVSGRWSRGWTRGGAGHSGTRPWEDGGTQVTLGRIEHDPPGWTRLECAPVGTSRRWVVIRQGIVEIQYDPRGDEVSSSSRR